MKKIHSSHPCYKEQNIIEHSTKEKYKIFTKILHLESQIKKRKQEESRIREDELLNVSIDETSTSQICHSTDQDVQNQINFHNDFDGDDYDNNSDLNHDDVFTVKNLNENISVCDNCKHRNILNFQHPYNLKLNSASSTDV